MPFPLYSFSLHFWNIFCHLNCLNLNHAYRVLKQHTITKFLAFCSDLRSNPLTHLPFDTLRDINYGDVYLNDLPLSCVPPLFQSDYDLMWKWKDIEYYHYQYDTSLPPCSPVRPYMLTCLSVLACWHACLSSHADMLVCPRMLTCLSVRPQSFPSSSIFLFVTSETTLTISSLCLLHPNTHLSMHSYNLRRPLWA